MGLIGLGVNCNWNGQIIGTVHGGSVIIHSSGQTISISSFPHVENITLGAFEEIYEVVGIASGMGLDRTHVIVRE